MKPEIRKRVFAAAQALYEGNNLTNFPTVDDVRRTAKVSMSDTSTAMKEWRQLHMSRTAPVADKIPEAIVRSHLEGLSSLWRAAQQSAYAAPQTTSVRSKVKLSESGALNTQLSDTNKALSVELEKVQQELEQNKRTLARSTDLITILTNDQARLMKRLEDAELARKTAEARADQMERQAEDLRQEVNRAEENLRMAHTTIFTNKKLTDQKEARLKEQPASAEKSPSLKKGKDAGKQ